jgi:hypothetical protein
MDAKVCDRCKRVILNDENIEKLSIKYGDKIDEVDLDICPRCAPTVETYIYKRIFLENPPIMVDDND